MYYNESKLNRSDGVVVYIKENITESTNIEIYDRLSIINTKIRIDNEKNLEISSIYRSHDISKTEFILSLEAFLRTKLNVKNHYIVGDFNIDILGQDIITLEFLNNFLEKGYTPSFIGITRPSGNNNSGTCIDNIFIKSESNNAKSYKLEQALTDHYPLVLSIDNSELNELNENIKENSNKINYSRLKNIVETKNWDYFKYMSNPNHATDAIIAEIQICMNLAVQSNISSKSKNKNRPRKSWITKGVINSFKTKENLYKIWKKNPSNVSLKKDFKNYEKILNKVIKDAKCKYDKKKIESCKQNTKHLWDFIKDKLDKKSKKGNKIDFIKGDNGTKITNLKEMANYMNTYFSTIGEKLSQKIKQPLGEKIALPSMNPNTIFLKPTNYIEISRIIDNMKDKSGGVDNINTKVLKTISKNIAEPLAHIFNICITQSIWPDALKKAEVVPIHKGYEKHNVSNYRPISLISNIAKIFEKVIYDRIYSFVQENKLINPKQFGFVKNKGTKDALAFITNIIYNKLDRSKPIMVSYLDLAKAFDTVNHDILLDKLYNYGIRGNAHNLLKNYLTNREQIVKLQNTRSNSKNITVGVPQGTLLGPLLFILYVNDLLNNLPKGQIVSYADDTAIISTKDSWKDTQDEMNEILSFVNKWLVLNKLSLNINKTVYMTFGNYCDSVPHDVEVKICDTNLKRVECYKYLGIDIDYNVKWDKHIDSIVKKTKYLLFIFYKMAKIMQTKTLLMLYYAFFNSIIIYGIIAWGGLYKNSLRPLQNLQNRILKIIYKNKFVTIGRPLNIEQLFTFESLVYHYDELKNIYKDQTINTRKKSIQLPKISKTISNKNSYIVAIRTFNSLTNDLKNLEYSKETIKKKLKQWVTKNI